MVTINQVKDGVVLYIEKELVGKMNGLIKWGFAFACNQIVANLNLSQYIEMGKKMGYVTQDSLVDIDRLYADFVKVAREQGAVIQHFPIVGDVTFSERDVDLLKSYIVR